MAGIWTFLKRDKNRVVLGWIGGGLAVVAAGAWAVITYVLPDGKGGQGKATVSAECGSVAAGKDITGTTITIKQDGTPCPRK